MLDKLHVIISIVAAIMVTLLSIMQPVTLGELAVRLITVIVAFYLIGLAAKIYLVRFVFPKPQPPEVLEESAEAKEDIEASDKLYAFGEGTEFGANNELGVVPDTGFVNLGGFANNEKSKYEPL